MGWASSTMYSHSRKEEIQELVFSSQLTNHCLAFCWGTWVSLSCTSPVFISPGLCLLSGGGVRSQTVGHSPWPRGPKAEFFQIDFVYGVFVCTLPLQRSKAFSCVSIQPMTVDLDGRPHGSHVIFFISHTLLSLARRTGLGERGIATDNLQMWFISWVMGGPA